MAIIMLVLAAQGALSRDHCSLCWGDGGRSVYTVLMLMDLCLQRAVMTISETIPMTIMLMPAAQGALSRSFETYAAYLAEMGFVVSSNLPTALALATTAAVAGLAKRMEHGISPEEYNVSSNPQELVSVNQRTILSYLDPERPLPQLIGSCCAYGVLIRDVRGLCNALFGTVHRVADASRSCTCPELFSSVAFAVGAYPNDSIMQAVQNAVKNADRYYRVVSEGQQRDPVTMANAFKVCSV